MNQQKENNTGITGLVLAKNEADQIGACLETLTWCDELIVIDDNSDDETLAIAREYTDRVIEADSSELEYFGELWYRGTQQADTEWVYRADADERVTDAVRRKVIDIASDSDKNIDVVHVPRKTYVGDTWITGATVWPDWTPALIRCESMVPASGDLHKDFNFKPGTNHEKLDPDTYAIPHYADASVRAFFQKQRRYARINSQSEEFSLYAFLVRPLLIFAQRYIIMKGYKEGWVGLGISLAWAWFEFETQLLSLKDRLNT